MGEEGVEPTRTIWHQIYSLTSLRSRLLAHSWCCFNTTSFVRFNKFIYNAMKYVLLMLLHFILIYYNKFLRVLSCGSGYWPPCLQNMSLACNPFHPPAISWVLLKRAPSAERRGKNQILTVWVTGGGIEPPAPPWKGGVLDRLTNPPRCNLTLITLNIVANTNGYLLLFYSG